MKYLITIIDNDADVLELLNHILTDAGYEVKKLSRFDGLEDLVSVRPDLIVLDEKLSDLQGHDICLLLKAKPATRDIPVMLLSAVHNLAEIAAKCKADCFIEKPFDLQHLLNSIAVVLSTK